MRRKPTRMKALAAFASAAVCLVLAIVALSPYFGPADVPEKAFPALPEVTDVSGAAQVALESTDADATTESAPQQAVKQAGSDAAPAAQEASSERYEGEVLVELADGCSVEDLNECLSELDFVATEHVPDEDVALGWVKLELIPGCDVDWAMAKLGDCDALDGAQPNFVYSLMDVDASGGKGSSLAAGGIEPSVQSAINDAVAIAQYGNRWWLEVVGAYGAWKTRTVSGAVTVAVIDTGCAASHVDLSPALDAGNCYNTLTGAKGFSAVNDTEGHGTHVCGIIAATVNNGVGIAGISHGAKLMPVKVTSSTKSSTADLVKAYQFIMKRRAAGENVRIVNMSMGIASQGYDSALLSAIDQAYYDYNILSVFAGGNWEKNMPYYCFPCDYSEVGLGVIGVSEETAAKLKGYQSSTSNFNVNAEKTKDLSAPGVNIVSTYPVGLSADSDYGRGYEELSGTSVATPVVSGIASLVVTKNPKLTAGELKSVLCSTAADIRRPDGSGAGFDQYTGYGLVRADKAVAGAMNCYLRGNDMLKVNSSTQLSVPRSGKWTWSSDLPGVAKVSSSGKVTGVSAGEAVISAVNTRTKEKLSRTVVVYDAIITGKTKVTVGKTITLNYGCTPVSACTWSSSNPAIATVNATSGKVKGVKAGKAVIRARLTSAPHITFSMKVTVVRNLNPMAVKGSVTKVSFAKLKKKAQKISGAVKFTKAAVGKVRYTKVSKGSSPALSINKKSGKVKVRKGTRRGTYKIKVKVKASGDASYKPRTRTVVLKVKVV